MNKVLIDRAVVELEQEARLMRARMERMEEERRELLEALQSCLSYGSMTGDDWVIDKARAAIDKAEGKA